MFMVLSSWQSHCESSPGSFDECRMAPSGRRPKTKPDDLGYESACTGCLNGAREGSMKNHDFRPYLGNDTTQNHSYYERRKGNRIQAFKWTVSMILSDI